MIDERCKRIAKETDCCLIFDPEYGCYTFCFSDGCTVDIPYQKMHEMNESDLIHFVNTWHYIYLEG